MGRGSAGIVVVGAGIAGMTCALALAARGFPVTVIERRTKPGGKMERLRIGESQIDTGPTVFTMRWVFDRLLAEAGTSLDALVSVSPLERLARHRWLDGSSLDLFADPAESADAIGAFAGRENAAGYERFCQDSARLFQVLNASFIEAQRPSAVGLARRIGMSRLGDMLALRPFSTMWSALGDYFSDARLRQLFARYATYCGGSPFLTPATLMLVAHVEQRGVWAIEGGLAALASALEKSLKRLGATVLYDREVAEIEISGQVQGLRFTDGERLCADAVVVNGDVSALAAGLFGARAATGRTTPPRHRSLSAMTWCMEAEIEGFELDAHTVLFSNDYRAEFDTLFRKRRVPEEPTTYLFAPERCGPGTRRAKPGEGLFCLINAPADGDVRSYPESETTQCFETLLTHVRRYGLTVTPRESRARTPSDYATLFPGTGGALYGRAPHGWMASFKRPGARTAIPGLYLAGGSAHPGPGVPMAALSGWLAAESLVSDRASMPRFHPAAISGGILTASARTDSAPSRSSPSSARCSRPTMPGPDAATRRTTSA